MDSKMLEFARNVPVKFVKPTVFICIGQSGSGKGTHSKFLQEFLSANDRRSVIRSVSGDLFREWIKADTYTAKLVKRINDRGEIQPYVWAQMLWANFLNNNFTGKEHIIFDGSPRAFDEAKAMESVFDFYGLKTVVICINVHDDICRERIIERQKIDGREDTSTIGKINEKLSWYHRNVMPAINYLRSSKNFRVVDIDGNFSREVVFKIIVNEVFGEKPAF